MTMHKEDRYNHMCDHQDRGPGYRLYDPMLGASKRTKSSIERKLEHHCLTTVIIKLALVLMISIATSSFNATQAHEPGESRLASFGVI